MYLYCRIGGWFVLVWVAFVYVEGQVWCVDWDLTNLLSIDCGMLKLLGLSWSFLVLWLFRVNLLIEVRLWLYVRLSLWSKCHSSTHFVITPTRVCQLHNCWCEVCAPIYLFLFFGSCVGDFMDGLVVCGCFCWCGVRVMALGICGSWTCEPVVDCFAGAGGGCGNGGSLLECLHYVLGNVW